MISRPPRRGAAEAGSSVEVIVVAELADRVPDTCVRVGLIRDRLHLEKNCRQFPVVRHPEHVVAELVLEELPLRVADALGNLLTSAW